MQENKPFSVGAVRRSPVSGDGRATEEQGRPFLLESFERMEK